MPALLQMGDFYEMFFEDARIAASILDIALTARIPRRRYLWRAFPTTLSRIPGEAGGLGAEGGHLRTGIRTGRKDPGRQAGGKGGHTRDLPARRIGFGGRLACVNVLPDGVSMALLNFATGVLLAGTLSPSSARQSLRLFPLPRSYVPRAGREAAALVQSGDAPVITSRGKDDFSVPGAARRICREWKVSSLDGFGLSDLDPPADVQRAAILPPGDPVQVRPWCRGDKALLDKVSMYIDPAAIENLEIAEVQGGHFSIL
jgi:DNA mismatch repair protein MutS